MERPDRAGIVVRVASLEPGSHIDGVVEAARCPPGLVVAWPGWDHDVGLAMMGEQLQAETALRINEER
jgi:hypothetical protein